MNTSENILGFYGKIPLKGDFVSQRLPATFVGSWDPWLQASLRASQMSFGDNWLEMYLTSPIWRFVLGANVFDDGSDEAVWAGVLMPSVDRVGRYFPLTLAVKIPTPEVVAAICNPASQWFDQVEQFALSALEDNFDLSVFDRQLQSQALPEAGVLPAGRPNARATGIRVQLPTNDHACQKETTVELCTRLIQDVMPTGSLWTTTGSASFAPALLLYEGLPGAESYVDFLSDPASPPPVAPKQNRQRAEEIPLKKMVDPSTSQQPNETQTLNWRSCAETHVGKRRKINQDALLDREDLGLWVVADGMGGHSAGDVASQTVVDCLGELSPTSALDASVMSTQDCLEEVNRKLLAMADQLGPEEIIGTTVVALLAANHHCAAIWAGDSRLYRLRDGRLRQITEDHSMASEMPKTSLAEPGCLVDNIVTRALGAWDDLKLDRIDFEAHPDDRFLLCSDGLTKEVHPPEIENILATNTCMASVRQLIDLALERNARDNVTAIVIDAGHE